MVAMTLVVALLAAGFAAGACLATSGWSRTVRIPNEDRVAPRSATADLRRRAATAVGFAVPVGLLTRWPVAALALGALGWFSTELFGSKAAREHATAKTEGIAAWTEMLRDTISGAHGLDEAVMT